MSTLGVNIVYLDGQVFYNIIQTRVSIADRIDSTDGGSMICIKIRSTALAEQACDSLGASLRTNTQI